ncbi:BLUF domain-containing protein [Belnapia sp. T18]|uniref:BLUF domain-containing protein n=1 Tax=Belnapia arida TaxID=2804533 RepID=A0ABS1UC27_9PROT|nr:BLUF domain-containing protein [Belnapia arida]MBL6082223.1 BLUF domain-containing protein [Belnapia arida]
MSEPFYRLAYFSRNMVVGPFEMQDAEVQRILAASRRNNTVAEVTGALLFNGRCFAQILEGPLDAVETTFERIQRDQRHSDITVLELTPVTLRSFATWSMAFAGKPEETRMSFNALNEASVERTGAAAQLFELLHGLVLREEGAA